MERPISIYKFYLNKYSLKEQLRKISGKSTIVLDYTGLYIKYKYLFLKNKPKVYLVDNIYEDVSEILNSYDVSIVIGTTSQLVDLDIGDIVIRVEKSNLF